MNAKFDELTKSLVQSVSRRAALKQFSLGLAGMALACFGMANKAEAKPPPQCLTAGQYCGTGTMSSIPASCLTNCCSHNAYRWGSFDNRVAYRCY